MTRKHIRIRGVAAALIAVISFALIPMFEPQAQTDASLAAGGLDGSRGIMQPVSVPARVSRVAHVPGTSGSEAWAIGHMSDAVSGWGSEQVVFLKYRATEGWSVFGPPLDDSGNPVKDLVLSNLSFAPNGEGWAVGTAGTMIHYTAARGWRYRSACGPGGPLSEDCGDLMSVSVTSEGSRTVGFAVGLSRRNSSLNTILKLDGSAWAIDPAALIPDPNPAVELSAVSIIDRERAWAVGGTSGRELQIFRRTSVGWQRQRTNKTIFDNPAPSNDNRTVNLSAIGHTVAASKNGETVWIGGGIYPVDPGKPLEQADTPFTLRWRDGSFVSYCPPQYSLQNDNASVTDVCDDPMPVSPYDISSLSLLDNGEVFAGGLGLFHFKDNVWWREPNAIGYLSSVSFVSPEEGWVASSGNTIGGGRTAASSSTALGHYVTRAKAETPRTARWPHYNQDVLFGVAMAPGSGEALAVGNHGIGMIYRPGIGWLRAGFAGDASLRSVAWVDRTRAWAVGERGAIASYRNRKFDLFPAAPTKANLWSLALAGDSGFAVGDSGTILRYSGGAWTTDPSSGMVEANLFDVAKVGPGYVAVGADSTILVNPSGSPGGWQRDGSLRQLLESDGAIPDLYTVTSDGAGATLVGGSRRTLAMREAGGPFRKMTVIDRLEGSILDAQAVSTRRGLEVFAAFSPFGQRFSARRTTFMHFDGSRWRDLDMSARQTAHIASDTAAIPDPVFGLALDPSGRAGWAVGGTLPNLTDELGNYQSKPSSAIYRFDLASDPRPPATGAPQELDPKAVTFAYFSESSCGSGYCSIAVGSGTLADEVALRIRDDINAASERPGGPKFVIFGGNMRATGIPEELEQFKGYLSKFRIPVFGALGPQDLFSRGAASQLNQYLPALPDEDLERAGLKPPVDAESASASNRFFLNTFADQYAPWGTSGRSHPYIRPVERGLPPTSGLARTHYAFDYAPGGEPVARFVVLDTSDRFYQKTAQGRASQNPPQQDQSIWLPDVVADARDVTRSSPLPVLVFMNVPTVDPLKAVSQPMMVDGPGFERAVSDLGLSAVISGFIRANASYPIIGATGITPTYILGGGGGPPPSSSTKYVNDGFYHAWGLVEVDTSQVSLLNPRAKVNVSPVPVLESVALHPADGLEVEGGWTLPFHALGRAVVGGGPPGDPDQKRMSYLQFPPPGECLHDGLAGRDATCLNQSAIAPDYQFVSENPDIADFVLPGTLARYPAVVDGFLVPDDKFGFLCTFKAGTAWVKIVSGGRQMRLPVTVGEGSGPCVDHPIRIIKDPEIPPRPQPEEPPIPTRPLFHQTVLPDPLVVVIPPVPAPIPAPAPPASAAGARKEEEEAQFEEQGDSDNEARVLSYQPRSQGLIDPVSGWLMVSATALMGAFAAIAAGSIVASKRGPQPNQIYVSRRTSRRKEWRG